MKARQFLVLSVSVLSLLGATVASARISGTDSPCLPGPESVLSEAALDAILPVAPAASSSSRLPSQIAGDYNGPYVCRVIGIPSLITYIGRSLFTKDAAFAEAYRKCYGEGNRTCRFADCL